MNMSTANRPTAEQIAACAYLIWIKEGRPQGQDVAHWLQAEKQLLAVHHHDNGTLTNAPTAKPGRGAKAGVKRVKEFQELVA